VPAQGAAVIASEQALNHAARQDVEALRARNLELELAVKAGLALQEDIKALRERNAVLERELDAVRAENVLLANREFAMRQDYAVKLDETRPALPVTADSVFIGHTIDEAGRRVRPYHIALGTLQKSTSLLGRMGSGKSSFGKVITAQLKQRGIGVVVFDRSGEYRPLFAQDDIILEHELQFNPFDSYGYWDDDALHDFVANTFFGFLDTARGATNLGSLQLLVKHYLQETKPRDRNLAGFAAFIDERYEIFGIGTPTANSILGWIRVFLNDPNLQRVFACEQTNPKIKRLVTQAGSCCIVLNEANERVRSIVTASILKQLARKMFRDFKTRGLTTSRPLTTCVIVEETADIVKGRAEKAFFREQLRDSRKAGLAYMLFPRTESNLAELGINNVLEEVGVIGCFQINEYPQIRHPAFLEALKARAGSLTPGQAVFLQDGRVDVVQCAQHEEILVE
jgi:hypothetical protein